MDRAYPTHTHPNFFFGNPSLTWTEHSNHNNQQLLAMYVQTEYTWCTGLGLFWDNFQKNSDWDLDPPTHFHSNLGFLELFSLKAPNHLWKWKVTLIGTGRSNLTSRRSCVQSSGTNVPLTMSSVFQRSVRDWSLVSGLPLCCKTVQRRWQLEIVKNCQNYQKHTLFIPSPPIKRAVLKCWFLTTMYQNGNASYMTFCKRVRWLLIPSSLWYEHSWKWWQFWMTP